MIDFKNTIFQSLTIRDNDVYRNIVSKILTRDEWIAMTFEGYRDGVVFTDKRIITINIQGFSGKKIDLTSIPYSNITAHSIETAGAMDYDSELTLWVRSVGAVRFQFTTGTDIYMIGKTISDYVL